MTYRNAPRHKPPLVMIADSRRFSKARPGCCPGPWLWPWRRQTMCGPVRPPRLRLGHVHQCGGVIRPFLGFGHHASDGLLRSTGFPHFASPAGCWRRRLSACYRPDRCGTAPVRAPFPRRRSRVTAWEKGDLLVLFSGQCAVMQAKTSGGEVPGQPCRTESPARRTLLPWWSRRWAR
jgi:hypothetical protein